MENKDKIWLPGYSWFYSNQQGKWVMNAYSGSVGTSRTNGCLCNTTFNYRVSIKTPSDEEPYIQGEYFFILPMKQGGGKTEVVSERFENSERGLEEVGAWLYAQSDGLRRDEPIAEKK